MPQLVWIAQRDGHHDFVNQRWHDFTGTTLEESQGELWANLLHPDDRQWALDRWRSSLKTGEPYEGEYRLRRALDGAYRWFLARALPLRNQQGRIMRWVGTCTEIEDQKQAQTELADAKARLEESDARKNECAIS